MRTPPTQETRARILAFLAKVRAGKRATVIRPNRERSRVAAAASSS
jgi:hypothetical protein